MQAFTPLTALTQTVNATSTNTAVSFGLPAQRAQCMRVYNAGPNVAFVNFVDTPAAVATADMPIAVGFAELFSKGLSGTVNVICAAGETAKVFLTPGQGI